MAGTLPDDAQTSQRPTDTFGADLPLPCLRQVVLPQRSRPDRRMVAQLAGIGVKDLITQRINNLQRRAWTPPARTSRHPAFHPALSPCPNTTLSESVNLR